MEFQILPFCRVRLTNIICFWNQWWLDNVTWKECGRGQFGFKTCGPSTNFWDMTHLFCWALFHLSPFPLLPRGSLEPTTLSRHTFPFSCFCSSGSQRSILFCKNLTCLPFVLIDTGFSVFRSFLLSRMACHLLLLLLASVAVAMDIPTMQVIWSPGHCVSVKKFWACRDLQALELTLFCSSSVIETRIVMWHITASCPCARDVFRASKCFTGVLRRPQMAAWDAPEQKMTAVPVFLGKRLTSII